MIQQILPMVMSQYKFQRWAAWEIKIVLVIKYNQMKDQEREAEGTTDFKGQYSHYTVYIKMEDKDRLLIEVEDSISFNRWRKVIDGQFIEAQEDPFYASNFTEPVIIFDFICENFSEVSFKPDIFNFVYSYGSSKNRRTRIMTIPLEKQQTSPTDLAHVRIDKMRQEFADKLTQRDAKVKSLEENCTEMRDILMKVTQKLTSLEDRVKKEQQGAARLEVEVRQLSVRITKEQEENTKLQETCRKVHQRLQKQEERGKKLQEKLDKEEERSKRLEQELKREKEKVILLQKGHKESNASTAKQVQVLNERQKYCEKFIDFRIFNHCSNNPHSQYYTLTNCTATSAKLTKVGGGWYNFVNRTEVLPKQHNKYAVRILKATSSNLMIGFCTEKGLGVTNNHNQAESVYYYCCSNGSLYENGAGKGLSGCGSVDGDVVEVLCDLLEGRVSWRKGGKVLAECAVPASMKGRPVFLSILQYCEGDAAEVNSL